MKSFVSPVMVVLLCGCGPMTSEGPRDAAVQVDAGQVTEPAPDSGRDDAGAPDAATTADAAVVDAGPADAGAADASIADAGESVRLRTEPCSRVAASASRCESLEVTCGGASPAVVDVAVFEPAAGVARRGFIMFGSGGSGTGFYNFRQRSQLTALGFTVLERRWVAPNGWFDGLTEGPQQGGCRLAAMLRYYKATLAPTGLACATGNSGGSAELTYALTWHRAGASLNFAMPSSGPFHRLDLACQGQNDTAWVSQCQQLVQSRCPQCASTGCQVGGAIVSLIDSSFGAQPRCSAPTPADLTTLTAASPIAGPAVSSLSSVPVHFLVGVDDNGPYAALATALSDSLADAGVPATMQYVRDAGHEMDQYPAGAQKLVDELLANCQ